MTQEEKAKAYDEALMRTQQRWECGDISREMLEYFFPELQESEDERIRKDIKRAISIALDYSYFEQETADDCIAWLEKQGSLKDIIDRYKDSWYNEGKIAGMAEGLTNDEKYQQGWHDAIERQSESNKSLYIRFGDIPNNGKSKVYNGEIEIGIEEGISVYPAFEDKEGNIILGLNLPITKTSLHTQQHLLEYDNRPCYLVTGDYVGKGTDGEPLIKNVRIIKEIKPYRVKEDKENNTYVINNTPNCGISVYYSEELKKSEDERIRKALIDFIKSQEEDGYMVINNFSTGSILAWLEKQSKKSQKTLSEMLEEYFANTPKEQIDKNWEELKH